MPLSAEDLLNKMNILVAGEGTSRKFNEDLIGKAYSPIIINKQYTFDKITSFSGENYNY